MLRPALAALLLAVLATGSAHAAGSPSLRLMRVHPLKLQGGGFAAGERVRVVARAGGESATTHTRASERGGFVATFRTLSGGRCASLVVVATGSHGDRARLMRRQPECPPD